MYVNNNRYLAQENIKSSKKKKSKVHTVFDTLYQQKTKIYL
jgi:hypothetical protein